MKKVTVLVKKIVDEILVPAENRGDLDVSHFNVINIF